MGCKPRVRVFRNMNRESHPYPGFPFSVGYQIRVPGAGSWYLEPDTRHRIDAEGRIPSTEGRVGHREVAHRVCNLQDRYRVPGIGHRIRCPAFGPRPSTWTNHAARSYLPRPSFLHGRGPDPEPRGPNRETRPWGLHTRCARFPVAGLGLRRSVFGPRRRTGSGAGYQVPGAR
jgi:hypothetical protein